MILCEWDAPEGTCMLLCTGDPYYVLYTALCFLNVLKKGCWWGGGVLLVHSEIFYVPEETPIMHCIPAEDLLPQRKHKGSWDEDKAYSTPGKYYPTLLELCTYFFRVK
jgi:hypothetical protein